MRNSSVLLWILLLFQPAHVLLLAINPTVYASSECFQDCLSGQVQDPCLISIHRSAEFVNSGNSISFLSVINENLDLVLVLDETSIINYNSANPLNFSVTAADSQASSAAGYLRASTMIFSVTPTQFSIFTNPTPLPDVIQPLSLVFSSPLSGALRISSHPIDANTAFAIGSSQIMRVNVSVLSEINITEILEFETLFQTTIQDAAPAVIDGVPIFIVTHGTPLQSFVTTIRLDSGFDVLSSNFLLSHSTDDIDFDFVTFEALISGGNQFTVLDLSDPRNPVLVYNDTVEAPIVDSDFFPRSSINSLLPSQSLFTAMSNGRVRLYGRETFASTVQFVTDFDLTPQLNNFGEYGIVPTNSELRAIELSSDGVNNYFLSQVLVHTATGDSGLMTFCAGDFFLRRPSSTGNSNTNVAVGVVVGLVGCCCIVSFSVGIGGLVFWQASKIKRRRKKVYEMTEETRDIPPTKGDVPLLSGVRVFEDIILGKGHFGAVYKGDWSGNDVALKSISNDDMRAFVEELNILKDLDHPHILHCFGIFRDHKGTFYMVTEFMDLGDARSFLLSQGLSLEVQELITMAKHCANGMNYIHQKKVVHRDLAARNLLVTGKKGYYTTKVADLGLSVKYFQRSRYTEEYYNSHAKELPIRWTAPEALQFRKFDQKSDVWSFGVVLWEIFSLGAVPYDWMTNQQVVSQVREGYRLPVPPNVPVYLGKVIISCWHEEPSMRPSFAEIYDLFPRESLQTTTAALHTSAISNSLQVSAVGNGLQVPVSHETALSGDLFDTYHTNPLEKLPHSTYFNN